jgi:hypothetical protein
MLHKTSGFFTVEKILKYSDGGFNVMSMGENGSSLTGMR